MTDARFIETLDHLNEDDTAWIEEGWPYRVLRDRWEDTDPPTRHILEIERLGTHT